MESLAMVKCQRIVLFITKLLIRPGSTGQLPSGVFSLGSRILLPIINILWENNAFRLNFNTRATKYFKPRNIDIWPFCCRYILPVIVTVDLQMLQNKLR